MGPCHHPRPKLNRWVEDMENGLVFANDDHTDLCMCEPGTTIPNVPGAATRLSPSGSSPPASRLALPPYANTKGLSRPVLESAYLLRVSACRNRGLTATSVSHRRSQNPCQSHVTTWQDTGCHNPAGVLVPGPVAGRQPQPCNHRNNRQHPDAAPTRPVQQ